MMSNEGEASATAGSTMKRNETKPSWLFTCSRHRLRAAVLGVLLVSAAVIGTLTYVITEDNEEENFKQQFGFNAREIIEQSKNNVDNTGVIARTFAALYPAMAEETDAELPFMNILDFEAFGIGARQTISAELVAYTPYIKNEAMRTEWNDFTERSSDWIVRGHSFYPNFEERVANLEPIYSDIYRLTAEGDRVREIFIGPFSPAWQMSPPPTDTEIVNFNYGSNTVFSKLITYTTETYEGILSEPVDMKAIFGTSVPTSDGPLSLYLEPVFDSFNPLSAAIKGHIVAAIPWVAFFSNLLQEGDMGIHVVVQSCYQFHTYEINGTEATYVGAGDLHDKSYNVMVQSAVLFDGKDSSAEHCQHEIFVYPTKTFEASKEDNDAAVYTTMVVLIFVFAAVMFLLYDWQMRRFHNKVVQEASQSEAIVSKLYPGTTRDQLFAQDTQSATSDEGSNGKVEGKDTLKDFMGKTDKNTSAGTRAIAELFPEATVLFADIAGFTAWSSIREPTQVFHLLESIFQAFDEIANDLGVFKVETVGDCYVAVCGVPEYNKDHAMVMARFARDCSEKTLQVLRGLEMTLGPDTGELAMRFGIHSGPVTAGVLRGDRARFQLFGDTVNTAARIESSGKRNKIHLSEQTASLIMAAGKSNWVALREDEVDAKGKGIMQTYWLLPKEKVLTGNETASQGNTDDATNVGDLESSEPRSEAFLAAKKSDSDAVNDRKVARLVAWNSELLLQLLQQVVARRNALNARRTATPALTAMATNIGNGAMVVEEVAEIIAMPEFDARGCFSKADANQVSEEAIKQLHDFVAVIARMYLDNPFHNFEHASHVTMSVSKLLSRIVAPQTDKSEDIGDEKEQQAALHDHTYGITSDPLTQFSVVLSALIHDIDHRGVPNFLLIKEEKILAEAYQGKSVAEQNSVDIAWNTLMSPDFGELRSCIFGDISELRRFRQLLVNSVIATDIFDKELGVLRKSRWEKAFREGADGSRTDINRKATIVIEHLIQASDVAHTMQHWHVYQKWNERLFKEMYDAFTSGRSDKDPSDNWYQGEIGFFDHYIIPLAKKLKNCGVFGVSSDEYLNYALANRREWEARGQGAVAAMKAKYGPKDTATGRGDNAAEEAASSSLSPKAADILARFSKK